jgi:molybdopterin-guanine dinucleotide biosynthesis protein A
MIGLVLCGGQSSRMGTDKDFIKSEDKTWVQTAANKIRITTASDDLCKPATIC